MFGLTQNEIRLIKDVLKRYNVHKSLVFGSRAKGNYKTTSDVDLAVDSNEAQISYFLNEESNIPYYFDVININKIKNKSLMDHIRRIGTEI